MGDDVNVAMHHKITPSHLERQTYPYVRQSTLPRLWQNVCGRTQNGAESRDFTAERTFVQRASPKTSGGASFHRMS